ncbi:hypothetical protein N7G274_009252 [Stereocaulon virgatum]|uniref:Uncharacterized protein n=1 Tax=Stereocaulon virgatum TaxID=373712 RepID=A0ABR3ZWM9_9LECA
MAALTREQARAFINKVRISNGGITPEDRARTPPDVLDSVQSLSTQLAGSIETLATDLYSSDARFTFELIQNVDDNQHTKAAEITCARKEPFLNFTFLPDQIGIDSNEHGFKEKHVMAICKVTQSTRTTNQQQQRYIGEKDIGFKSVFKVASKVHIQSDPFSSSFKHTRGELGLGTVTPFFEEPQTLPENIRTRITLFPSPTTDSAKLIKEVTDPETLPDSVLMFLTRLKTLTVTIFENMGLESKTKYSYQYNAADRRSVLTETSLHDAPKVTQYHFTRRMIGNLPEDVHRQGQNQAEVVPTFPPDARSFPIIEQQHVFAYLPVRQVGFSFQIQSNFVVPASRQDVIESAWNGAMLDGVARTFQDAVLQFCKHPTLRFYWVRYLPGKTISDKFWPKLLPKIVVLLKQSPFLLSRSGKFRKTRSQLKWLPGDAVDENGEPLFNDLATELYLSKGNNLLDKSALDALDVQKVIIGEACERVRADLSRPNSMLKSPTTTRPWHTRSAELLRLPFIRKWPKTTIVRELPLISLKNGEWVSVDSGQVFFSKNLDVPVPSDLGLRLVESTTLEMPARIALFSDLGVRTCVPKDVIALIIRRYNRWNTVNLQHSIEHLRCLYWDLPKDEKTIDKTTYLKDLNHMPVYRSFVTLEKDYLTVDDLYFESDDESGTKMLSMRALDGDKVFAPSFDAHFISKEYLGVIPPESHRNGLSWRERLVKFAKIRAVPCLVSPKDGAKLSDIFIHIMVNRKEQLVGTLKAHWSSYTRSMKDEIIETLSKARVPCEGATEELLGRTYLPLPHLKQRCADLGAEGAVPFLKLPSELRQSSPLEWDFLKTLHVRHEDDLDFYIYILRHFRSIQAKDLKAVDKVFAVYSELEKHSKVADHPQLNAIFLDEETVFVPSHGDIDACWTGPEECVWEAPGFLDLWHPLANTALYHGNSGLKRLFHGILQIANAGWPQYIAQIMKEKKIFRFSADLSSMYLCIAKDQPNEKDWQYIREQFEDEALVYISQERRWHPPSSCLWADDTRITGKFAIASAYPDLRAFFVNSLKVEEPNIAMYVQELKLLVDGANQPSITAVKGMIEEINSYRPHQGALDALAASPVLPVKNTDGLIDLKSSTDVFAIVDRDEYEKLFKYRVAVLDYTLEEAHELRPFISAMGLEGRSMSENVNEATTVNVSSRISRVSQDVKEKAYALFRCAVHYGATAPQDKALYQKFCATDVFESDEISKTLTLSLKAASPVIVEGARSILHIEEDEKQLRLYVPKDRKDRELCFLNTLPSRLVTHLGINDRAAVKAFGDVFKANAYVLDDLLTDLGLMRLPWTDPVSHRILGDESPGDAWGSTSHDSSNTSLEQPRQSRASTPGSDPYIPRYASNPKALGNRASTPSWYENNVSTPISQSSTLFSTTPRSGLTLVRTAARARINSDGIDNTKYKALLDYVIASVSGDQNATPVALSDTPFGVRSEDQVRHDIKLAAAGELYAFELILYKWELPNFNRDNWKSTIRSEVCVHEKYRDMPAWTGPETADIVYWDEGPEYILSGILAPYLPRQSLQEGARIKYYLEVKATTGEWRTRFSMSKAQVQRMRRTALIEDQPTATEVYVILRVFNLGKANMDVQIYTDPATMEKNGELLFEGESYTVTVPDKVPVVDNVDDLDGIL